MMTKIKADEAHQDISPIIDGSIYQHSHLAAHLAPNPDQQTYFGGNTVKAKEYLEALRAADPKRADMLTWMVSVAISDWVK